MENHPVPQNISSYEFHLVGDMTLKQFLYLAAGLVVAFVFLRLSLLPIIKYPLAGLSAMIGVLMAFVPINGRPFSSWLTAFVKAIYSPTEFIWVPDNLVVEIPAPAAPVPATAPPPATAPVAAKPAAPKTPPPEPAPVLPSFSDFLAQKTKSAAPSAALKETTSSQVTAKPTPPPAVVPAASQTLNPGQAIPISSEMLSNPISATDLPSASSASPSAPAFTQSQQIPKAASIASAPTASTTSLISPPTQPNILSGLVLDPQSQPLSQITVEIIDVATGIPARALRSNKLGQFQIAIPLPPGTYNVVAEKEGLKFAPASVSIKGGIIPPVIIQAKSA